MKVYINYMTDKFFNRILKFACKHIHTLTTSNFYAVCERMSDGNPKYTKWYADHWYEYKMGEE